MEFKSINEIVKHFKINKKDNSEIRNELKKLQKKYHPDKRKGKHTDIVYEINNALEFIDRNKNLSLTVKKNSSDVITMEFVKSLQKQNSEQLNERRIEKSSKQIKSYYQGPKITLGIITAILVWFFLFPEKILSHPIFSRLFLSNDKKILSILSIIYVICTLYLVFFWVLLFVNEHKAKVILEQMMLDSKQNVIMNMFKEYKDFDEFSKEELTDYIFLYYFPARRSLRSNSYISGFLFLGTHLDRTIIENIADIMINKAIEKEIISVIDKKSIIVSYKFN